MVYRKPNWKGHSHRLPHFVMFLVVSTTVWMITGCDDNPLPMEPGEPEVRAIIAAVNLDSLTLSVQQLSGETEVNLNGSAYIISSRHKDDPDNDLVADYIRQKLLRYGLTVENEYFSASGRNILAIQTGTRYPDQIYVICAHYDSMPDSSISPGADDNASGTATVLEAARVISKYETDYSVIYALWDEEEQGLFGSRYFATRAADTNIEIVGLINIDMIGWDSDDDNTVLIDRDEQVAAVNLANSVIETNETYEIGLMPEVTVGFGRSDHVPFWQNGFGAVLVIEDVQQDFNPDYHTTADRLSNFNPAFFQKCAQLVIGTLAELADVQE